MWKANECIDSICSLTTRITANHLAEQCASKGKMIINFGNTKLLSIQVWTFLDASQSLGSKCELSLTNHCSDCTLSYNLLKADSCWLGLWMVWFHG